MESLIKNLKFKIKNLIRINPIYVNTIDNKYGHKLTRRLGIPVNKKLEPLPWFTYPAIEYLKQLDLSDCELFEWGCGNSSLFFAKRVKSIHSIESNKEWFDKIQKDKCTNNFIFLEENKNKYSQIISSFDMKFDIIIIDGQERENCANISTEYLKDEGMIILDNSDRHPQIASFFRKKDFLQIDMHGLGPINNYTWTTSLFFKREANFQPIERQPVIPIGGGY